MFRQLNLMNIFKFQPQPCQRVQQSIFSTEERVEVDPDLDHWYADDREITNKHPQ